MKHEEHAFMEALKEAYGQGDFLFYLLFPITFFGILPFFLIIWLDKISRK